MEIVYHAKIVMFLGAEFVLQKFRIVLLFKIPLCVNSVRKDIIEVSKDCVYE